MHMRTGQTGLEILTTAQVRQLEQAALAQDMPLMERAGEAAADLAVHLLAHPDGRGSTGRRVLVIAGPGNNGGDALVCATHLKRAFFGVTTIFTGDERRLPADAARALAKWREVGGETQTAIPTGDSGRSGQQWDLVIDGLFGIGLSRPLEGTAAAMVASINALGLPVLALDVPSGLNADTGAIMGVAVRASHTLTFLARKPGLHTLDGPDCCGEIRLAALGTETVARTGSIGHLLDASVLSERPRRPANFHKGLAGDIGIIGGAAGMLGAALIAGRAALASGAGRVFVGMLATDAPALDMVQPELMLRPPAQLLQGCGVLALGPGLGTSEQAAGLLRTALLGQHSLVLDADALNLLGSDGSLGDLARQRQATTLLTPHPAEAARLLATTTAAIQQDRLGAALELARRYCAGVVLKGNGSIIADHTGAWRINASGNPGMASAGMGDALAGLLASLLAQGLAPLPALQLAAWVHGHAADTLLQSGDGPLGITASDVIRAMRRVLNTHG